MQGCGITHVGTTMLGDWLAVNTSLRHLDMSVNEVGDDGVAKFIKGLKHNTTMARLDVEYCGITHVGAAMLGDWLAANTGLRHLDVSQNNFGEDGLAKIIQGLKHNTKLTFLMMGHYNDPLSPALALELARLMEGNAALDVKVQSLRPRKTETDVLDAMTLCLEMSRNPAINRIAMSLYSKTLWYWPYESMSDALSFDVTSRAHGWAGLHLAASECWSLICSELIDRGADVTAADTAGNTPLHLAARFQDLPSSLLIGTTNEDARTRARDTVLALLGKATRLSNDTPQVTVSMLDTQL